MPVAVHGLRELQQGFKQTDKELGKFTRKALKDVAEPIKNEASGLASSQIRRVGVPWSKFRVGATQTLVYVAPRNRGVRSRTDPRHRGYPKGPPNMGDLLMDRAMEPALQHHAADLSKAVDRALGLVCDQFNGGH